MTTVKTIEKIDAREIRRKLGLNQQQFWSTLGVTQSGGSRYESGRNMPKPVRELLRLVHVEQVDIKNIKREDMDVIDYLKAQEPELYKSLKKSARSHAKRQLDRSPTGAPTATTGITGRQRPECPFLFDLLGEIGQRLSR